MDRNTDKNQRDPVKEDLVDKINDLSAMIVYQLRVTEKMMHDASDLRVSLQKLMPEIFRGNP